MSENNQQFADISHKGHLVTTRRRTDGSYETTFYISGNYAAIHITCTPSASRPAEIVEKDAAENHAYYARRVLELAQIDNSNERQSHDEG